MRKLINFYSPLKSSDKHWLSDDFRGNRSSLICSNLLNIISKIWRNISKVSRWPNNKRSQKPLTNTLYFYTIKHSVSFYSLLKISPLTVSFASFCLLLKKFLTITLIASLSTQYTCSSHVKFFLSEYGFRTYVAASLAVSNFCFFTFCLSKI